MASGAPSPGGWVRTPTRVPLIPVSSEYDRLLVQEPLNELGGGPMDPAADERLLVLNDASRIAAEGLAERIAARAASPRGVVLGSIACFALMCFAAFRKAESHDASLVARLSEGMFLGGHRGGEAEARRARRDARRRWKGTSFRWSAGSRPARRRCQSTTTAQHSAPWTTPRPARPNAAPYAPRCAARRRRRRTSRPTAPLGAAAPLAVRAPASGANGTFLPTGDPHPHSGGRTRRALAQELGECV